MFNVESSNIVCKNCSERFSALLASIVLSIRSMKRKENQIRSVKATLMDGLL